VALEAINHCDILCLETVFFKDGKPNLLIKLDEDYKIMAVRSGRLLKLANVPKFFLELAERRKEDANGVFYYKHDKDEQVRRHAERFAQQRSLFGEMLGVGVCRSSTIYQKLGKPKRAERSRQAHLAEAVFERIAATHDADSRHGLYHTDVAIVRYNGDREHEAGIISCLNRSLEAAFCPESVNLANTVHVVSKKGLTNLFRKQDIDEQWKAIESIQLTVKAALGCGFPIIVNFFAPALDSSSPVDYVLDSFGTDQQLLRYHEDQYCLKQVHKICTFIQKNHGHDILRMKCQFVKDNNDTIWLQRAFDIISRPSHRVQKRRAKFLDMEDSENLKAKASIR